MGGPPPLPPRPAELIRDDRRALLQFVLEMRGVTGVPDAVLDNIAVSAFLAAVRAGTPFVLAPGRVVPAAPVRTAEAAAPVLPARPASATAQLSVQPAAPSTSPFTRSGASALKTGARAQGESHDPASTSSDDDDDDESDVERSTSADTPVDVALPPAAALVLCTLPEDLEEELGLAAFQLHVACCTLANATRGAGDPLHTFVRAQLGVAPALASHLWRVLPAWKQRLDAGAGTAVVSLRLPVALLEDACCQGLPPRDLRRWQRVQLAQLLVALPAPRGTVLRAQLCDASIGPEGPSAATLSELCAAVDASGWSIPVDPLGVALYGALVRAQWDDLDDTNGTPLEEAPQLLASLRHTWPALGVGEAAHAAHCVFSAVQRWVIGGSVKALKVAARSLASAAPAFQGGSPLPPAQAIHVRRSLTLVLDHSNLLLEDYHSSFVHGADESFAVWLDLARALNAGRAFLQPSASPGFSTSSLICASLSAAYARCRTKAAPNGMTSRFMALLAQSVQGLVAAEIERFTPVLEQSEPAAACIATAHVQTLFARDLHEWLSGAWPLEDTVAGLKCSEALVAQLQSCAVGGAAGEPPPPIDIAALAEPIVLRWVAARLAQANQWMERALQQERWSDASHGPAAASAVDVVRAANEAAEAFFALRLQQAAPVRALTQGIAATLSGYATALLRLLGDPARRIPVAPPLTRFKHAAVELLREEHARHSAAHAAQTPSQPPKSPSQPQQQQQRAAHTSAAPGVDELLAMYNSLNFLLREVPALEHTIRRLWMSLAHATGTLRRGPSDLGAVTGLFSDTSATLRFARQQVLEHAANCVVFQQLHTHFIERAYLFGSGADENRLAATLLDPLNPWMERVCGGLGDDDRNDAAAAILAASLRGLRHVLLDGGPARIFVQDDCDALEADLAALRDFFVADGDGLPPEQVDAALVPVSRLLDAMAQDTHHLIALHDGGTSTVWDRDTLTRVLCHRGDRTSSKYLKAKLHTPKAVGFMEEKRHILSAALGHARASTTQR